jgi:hypothetical protein
MASAGHGGDLEPKSEAEQATAHMTRTLVKIYRDGIDRLLGGEIQASPVA